MRKQVITLFTLALFSVSLHGQNITNTLGTNGTFTIKDASFNNFMTLSLSDGYLDVYKSLTFPFTATDSTIGVIFKSTVRFIHNYAAPSTNGYNTFVGLYSGNFTMHYNASANDASSNTAVGYASLSSLTTGSNNSAFGRNALSANGYGYENSAFGGYALWKNTSGFDNSAFGQSSMGSNTTGYNNTAVGTLSMQSNTSGNHNAAFGYQSLANNASNAANSAFGCYSLYYNTADSNAAFGFRSLYANTTGDQNCAFGNRALSSNTGGTANSAFGSNSLRNATGGHNSAFGYQALYSNTTGGSNSAFGDHALYSCTGDSNTAIGYNAGYQITTGKKNTCIGYSAQVPNADQSNQVRIGGSQVTYAGVQVAWTVTSDRRWKSDIKTSNLGLEFLSKLRPVSYLRKNDEKQRTEYGFIAQEIEEVLKEQQVERAGMITVDDEGRHELRYNDLLAPMVKAIQELKTENDELKDELAAFRASVAEQIRQEVRAALLKATDKEGATIKVSSSDIKY